MDFARLVSISSNFLLSISQAANEAASALK